MSKWDPAGGREGNRCGRAWPVHLASLPCSSGPSFTARRCLLSLTGVHIQVGSQTTPRGPVWCAGPPSAASPSDLGRDTRQEREPGSQGRPLAPFTASWAPCVLSVTPPSLGTWHQKRCGSRPVSGLWQAGRALGSRAAFPPRPAPSASAAAGAAPSQNPVPLGLSKAEPGAMHSPRGHHRDTY